MYLPSKSSPMLTQGAKNGKGFKWYLEALIFLPVFLVSQILQTIPLSIAMMVWIFTSKDVLAALSHFAQTGDMTAYIEALEALTQMPPWLMLVQLFTTVFIIAAAVFYCLRIEKRNLASMGLSKKNAVAEYAVGAGIGFGLLALSALICMLTGAMKFSISAFSPLLFLLFFIGFVIQGASEEILCRGYLMNSTARKNSLPAALILNSVIFSLLHLGNNGVSPVAIVNIVLFGVFMSLYAIKRGNIWGVCAIHSFWNFAQGNLFGISVSGASVSASPLQAAADPAKTILSGGAFGIEGSLIVTVILSLAILATFLFMKQKTEEQA